MFFSVKEPIKIGGKPFRTCICYDLTDDLRATVNKLVEEGKAVLYPVYTFFCNGKPLVTDNEKATNPVQVSVGKQTEVIVETTETTETTEEEIEENTETEEAEKTKVEAKVYSNKGKYRK